MIVDRRWRFGNILQTTKKRFSSFTLMSYWAVKLRDRGIVVLLYFFCCSLFCSLCVLFLYFNIPWYFTLHNVLSFILYSFTLFVKFKVEVSLNFLRLSFNDKSCGCCCCCSWNNSRSEYWKILKKTTTKMMVQDAHWWIKFWKSNKICCHIEVMDLEIIQGAIRALNSYRIMSLQDVIQPLWMYLKCLSQLFWNIKWVINLNLLFFKEKNIFA